MDGFFKTFDIDRVYEQIFSAKDELTSTSKIVPSLIFPFDLYKEENSYLLCEWAVTCNREVFTYRTALALSLLRMYITNSGSEKVLSCVYLSHSQGVSIQGVLLKFLDTFRPTDEERIFVVRLFAEFIHAGLFSHDLYVRNLISRGVLEQDVPTFPKNTPNSLQAVHLQHWYVSQLPIFEGPNYHHEQNQRRAALVYSRFPVGGPF